MKKLQGILSFIQSVAKKSLKMLPLILKNQSNYRPIYLIESNEITFKGTKIAIPELTMEETKRLSEWSDYSTT